MKLFVIVCDLLDARRTAMIPPFSFLTWVPVPTLFFFLDHSNQIFANYISLFREPTPGPCWYLNVA